MRVHLESMKVCSTSLPFSQEARRRCTTFLNSRASSFRALHMTRTAHLSKAFQSEMRRQIEAERSLDELPESKTMLDPA